MNKTIRRILLIIIVILLLACNIGGDPRCPSGEHYEWREYNNTLVSICVPD